MRVKRLWGKCALSILVISFFGMCLTTSRALDVNETKNTTKTTPLQTEEILAAHENVRANQEVIVVWDSSCIVSITKSLKTRIEAPIDPITGLAQKKRATITGIDVKLQPGCERIEIRKKKK